MSASTEPLASAAPTTESIYTGIVPVVLKHADREDRATTLTVALAYGVAQPRNQKVLHVQLTDESDSFLLYTLDISEDEFHALKAEQSILVDFPTFPLKLVELLRHCQAAHAEENPRFVATLSTLGGAPVFALTEINTFRQVTHLSLRFVAGNDGAIKKYLAGRVADFKTDIAALREEGALRTRQLQETAALAAQQAERLRAADEEHARVASELHAQHAAAVAEVKEQSVAAQQGQARAADAERARLGEKAEAEVGAARQAQRAAEAQAASLTASSHELQLRLSDREAKLAGVEQEVALLRKTTAELREENAELAATKHRLEKAAGAKEVRRACPAPLSPHPSPPPPRTSAHLPLPLPSPRTQVELSALTQSVTDKEELLAKQAALLEAANDAKRNAMESAAHFKEDNLKLQARVAAAAAEITKGNTIIAKLQGDKKGLQGKLKLKAAVIAQQHEAAAAKQSELETSERAAAETRAKLAEATAEKERSDEGGEATKAQLAEAQELLRSNQQVIQWLNKELNDAQSGHRLYGGAYASRMAAFRPAAGGSAASAMASAMPTTAASAMGTPTKPTAASELKERAAMMAGGGGGGGGGFGSAVMAPVGACAAAPPAATAGMASLRSKAGMAAVSSPPPARAAASAKAEDGAVGGGGFSAYLSPASGTQGGATA